MKQAIVVLTCNFAGLMVLWQEKPFFQEATKMKRFAVLFSILAVFAWSGAVWANSAPSVNNITASQRTDGSGIVDIYYTLSDADNDRCTVSIEVSDDGGGSWDVTATDLSGDIGENISPGGRHITWYSKTDLPGVYGTNYRVKVIADDGVNGMVWVYINDPGVSGHMSKYETTNAQYCQYLNEALASGDVYVSDNKVYGNSGEYINQVYFDTYEYITDSQITYSGGVFSVRSRDGYSMANHPVVLVSWYGATAFCNYYGYRLPTEWEWQAVADYDGSYIYGCGTTIDQSKANYDWDNPLGLTSPPYTSPVDHYSSYGYGMNDMAANVWEWTSSCYYADCDRSYRVLRGGSWANSDHYCTVSYRHSYGSPNYSDNDLGFRVCR